MTNKKFIRSAMGTVIGLAGFCTMASLDNAIKKAEMPGKSGKIVKGIGRFTLVYALYAAFLWLAYKLIDEPYIKQQAEYEEDDEDEEDEEDDLY